MTELYTPQAEKRLKHLFNLLGLRIIPCYFYEKNPGMYTTWQYNACNQTALITAYVLAKLLQSRGLNDSNPFYKSWFNISIYEGIFTEDNFPGQYNHAYLHALETINRQHQEVAPGQAMGFFIDVGRVSNPTVFKMGPGINPLPVYHSDAYQMHSVQKLDLKAMMYEQLEFFTALKGIEICEDIEAILAKLGFDLRTFNWKA